MKTVVNGARQCVGLSEMTPTAVRIRMVDLDATVGAGAASRLNKQSQSLLDWSLLPFYWDVVVGYTPCC